MLGRTPGRFDPDHFNNIDRVGNDKINPKAAELKKQATGSASKPSTSASTQAQQPAAPTQQGGISLALPGSAPITVGGAGSSASAPTSAPATTTPAPAQANTTPPLINQPITVNDPNTGKDVTFTSSAQQPAASPQQATQASSTPAKTTSSGSIVDYLAGSGQASDFASRSKMAAQYGIQNYKGTAEQNTQLLNKLKANEKMPQ